MLIQSELLQFLNFMHLTGHLNKETKKKKGGEQEVNNTQTVKSNVIFLKKGTRLVNFYIV